MSKAIYLDFFNILCTSCMYFIKQLQFIIFCFRHLRLGRSILVLAVRESHQWWIPSSWLPLLDSIRDLASPRFLLRFSLPWIPMYQIPFNIILWEQLVPLLNISTSNPVMGLSDFLPKLTKVGPKWKHGFNSSSIRISIEFSSSVISKSVPIRFKLFRKRSGQVSSRWAVD